MRRSCGSGALRWPSLCAFTMRLYRTPVGGDYFEQPLPRSLGANRGKGGISTVNIEASKRAVKRRKSIPRRKLTVPLTAEGLKERLRQLSMEGRECSSGYSTNRRDNGVLRHPPCAHESRAVLKEILDREERVDEGKEGMTSVSTAQWLPVVSETRPALMGDGESDSMHATTDVGCTVLGSDLDELERSMLRDYSERGKELPTFDNVYAPSSSEGEGRSTPNTDIGGGWPGGVDQGGDGPGTPEGMKEEGDGGPSMGMLPAEANPHFPVEACGDEAEETMDVGCAVVWQGETTETMPSVSGDCVAPGAGYDAYRQRPADDRLVALRGTEFWDDAENRRRLRELTDYAAEGCELEMMREGAMDTSEVGYSTNVVRKETFLYFQAHPINEMIQEPYARVRSIAPSDGGAEVYFPAGDPETDVDIPTAQARAMARELGLDLIKVDTVYTPVSGRRVVAVCSIADHREHLRDMVRFKMKKLGVQRPPTKECIEVPFRGGTHPHAVRFKSIGVAKHLLLGHVVRINLTDFGSAREGFPVFRTILDEVARQSLQLRAYHTAGAVRANYNEVYCYLYPSTGRSPKSTVLHPAQQELDAACERRLLEQEREVYFDGLYDKKTPRERLTYMRKLQDGTAWADRDDGLSLQRQRDMKLMLGYLPKGNHELYAARGDVDVPAPFRASHPTSVDRWTHPRESNLEQAARGAAVLGKRLSMSVSEMHDCQETAENPTTLDRFYYRIQGPALEAGELKEALGLKNNRKRLPRQSPGWATLGMEKVSPEEPGFAAK